MIIGFTTLIKPLAIPLVALLSAVGILNSALATNMSASMANNTTVTDSPPISHSAPCHQPELNESHAQIGTTVASQHQLHFSFGQTNSTEKSSDLIQDNCCEDNCQLCAVTITAIAAQNLLSTTFPLSQIYLIPLPSPTEAHAANLYRPPNLI